MIDIESLSSQSMRTKCDNDGIKDFVYNDFTRLELNTQIAIAEQLKRIADVLECAGNSEGGSLSSVWINNSSNEKGSPKEA